MLKYKQRCMSAVFVSKVKNLPGSAPALPSMPLI